MAIWQRRVWPVVRGLICWLGAIAVVAAGFLVPLLVTWRVVTNAVIAAMGPPHNDLSDIGPVILGLLIGAMAGLAAGAIGSMIASVPALALIDRSGVFNKLKRRRARSRAGLPRARR